jgi:hypothetical protein
MVAAPGPLPTHVITWSRECMDDCAAHSYMDSGLVAGRGYLIILVFFSRAYVASAEFFEVCVGWGSLWEI